MLQSILEIQKARGQAMSELLVSLAVIAPMFLLIPVVANYLDIQTATHEASRYVAWEHTAYAEVNEAQLSERVRERFIEGESSGFSNSATNDAQLRWRDYGRNFSSAGNSLIDSEDDVSVSARNVPVDISSPVSNSTISAIQATTPDVLIASSVSFPLDSEGSLLAIFNGGANYLDVNAQTVSAPFDSVARRNRFHTRSTSAILVASNVIPQNEGAYTNMTNEIVTTDGSRLRGWQAPLRLLDVVTLGFFEELDILQAGGDLEAVSDEQSTILPEGLVQYVE